MPGEEELTTLRVSTAQFPDKDAVEGFREIFGRTILRVDMQPLHSSALEADMTLRAFPGFGMASGTLSAMRAHHTSRLIDSDDLVIVFLDEGTGVLDQHGRTTEIKPGQAALTDTGVPGVFSNHQTVCAINLRLNRQWLFSQLADAGAALLAQAIPDSAALRLLKSYAKTLSEGLSLPAEVRAATAAHMHDLAALALGANRESAELAKIRGVRAARLSAIKTYIAANLSHGRLSAEAAALAHNISPRYVRALFEDQGTSFSEFVIRQRLQRAYRMLADPRFARHTISAIAFRCGFSDLSYFNRSFRRRFGMTPSDVRAASYQPPNL